MFFYTIISLFVFLNLAAGEEHTICFMKSNNQKQVFVTGSYTQNIVCYTGKKILDTTDRIDEIFSKKSYSLVKFLNCQEGFGEDSFPSGVLLSGREIHALMKLQSLQNADSNKIFLFITSSNDDELHFLALIQKLTEQEISLNLEPNELITLEHFLWFAQKGALINCDNYLLPDDEFKYLTEVFLDPGISDCKEIQTGDAKKRLLNMAFVPNKSSRLNLFDRLICCFSPHYDNLYTVVENRKQALWLTLTRSNLFLKKISVFFLFLVGVPFFVKGLLLLYKQKINV
jgi:hypothetical protein